MNIVSSLSKVAQESFRMDATPVRQIRYSYVFVSQSDINSSYDLRTVPICPLQLRSTGAPLLFPSSVFLVCIDCDKNQLANINHYSHSQMRTTQTNRHPEEGIT